MTPSNQYDQCFLNDRIPSGNSPPPVPQSEISRATASLLHRLWIGSPFTGSKLSLAGRKSDDKYPACSVPNDIEHVLPECCTYDTRRNGLFGSLSVSGSLYRAVPDNEDELAFVCSSSYGRVMSVTYSRARIVWAWCTFLAPPFLCFALSFLLFPYFLLSFYFSTTVISFTLLTQHHRHYRIYLISI